MARLLTLLLLYQAGFEVGRYISLEKLIENQREGYYDALYKSSQGWHDGVHTLLPCWEYFLGVMLQGAYHEFERRTGELPQLTGPSGRGSSTLYRGCRTNFRWQILNEPVRASAARLSIAPFETFARRVKSVALKEVETLFGRKRDQNPIT